MRHTLIPAVERNILRREYHIRLIIVTCFTVSLAGIVGVSCLFPAFIRSVSEEKAKLDEIAVLEKEKNATGIVQIENELASDNILLEALSVSDTFRFSDKIQDIIRLRGNSQITSLLLVRVSTSSMTSIIQGISPTRESLLAFKTRLENNPPGTSVDLPLAQLAKSKDIQYSIQVTQQLQ